MRRIVTFAGSVALIGLLGAGLVSASSTEPSISEPRDIHLLATITEENFVDTGDAGPTLGDVFVFRDRLSKGGEKVGHDGGVCTLTTKRSEFNCQVTLDLEGGQIAVQGLISEAGPEPHTFVLPVTGGSGVYRNVRGQVRIVELSPEEARLTLHLIP